MSGAVGEVAVVAAGGVGVGGGAAATTALAEVSVEEVPSAFVANTRARSVWPTSAAVSV
jgi:hypothetical protein